MKRGYPEFAWKQRFLDKITLNINDEMEDRTPIMDDDYEE